MKKDIEYFLRYDLVKSNPIKEQQIGWNNTNTGKAIITGLHYSLLKNISLSLNYQYWNPDQFDLKHAMDPFDVHDIDSNDNIVTKYLNDLIK